MATLRERVLNLIRSTPGLTDREITERIMGLGSAQQAVNQAARRLTEEGLVIRRQRHDGKLGNYPAVTTHGASAARRNQEGAASTGSLEEDDVKRKLQAWLEAASWKVSVSWGRGQGIDVEAFQGDCRWVIEVKGCGSRHAMRVNYFLAVLAELLQRMDDSRAKYSIALPDLPQFRGLWKRLPALAKQRIGISALFVADSGQVDEVDG
jgi:hypothetical protein